MSCRGHLLTVLLRVYFYQLLIHHSSQQEHQDPEVRALRPIFLLLLSTCHARVVASPAPTLALALALAASGASV